MPSLSEVDHFLKSKQGNLVYLSGESVFFVEESIERIKGKVLTESLKDFNLDVFFGREKPISSIFDVIKTLPLMAQQRLVILRKAEELREKDWSVLMPLLHDPVPSTFLIFVGNKLDGRKKITKDILKKVKHFHFSTPYENELPQWVSYICQKLSMAIHHETSRLLIQIVGSDLMELRNELLKLKQYLGERQQLTSEDVLNVTSRIRLQNVFELSKAIGYNDAGRAFLCLAHLLQSGQNEVGILSMLHRHVRLLRQAKEGARQGLTGHRLARFLGVPMYFLNEYTQQTRMWTDVKIEKTYKVLCETDKALKSSPISGGLWLENFVVTTCQS